MLARALRLGSAAILVAVMSLVGTRALGAEGKLARQVRTHGEYFQAQRSRALGGQVAPTATVVKVLGRVGLGGRFGLGVDLGLAKVTANGKTQLRAVLSKQHRVGGGIAAGGSGTRYVGEKGMKGREVIPGKEKVFGDGLVYVGGFASVLGHSATGTASKSTELMVGLHAPGYGGTKRSWSLPVFPAVRSKLLRLADRGQRLARQAQTALDSGNERLARQKVADMKELKPQIAGLDGAGGKIKRAVAANNDSHVRFHDLPFSKALDRALRSLDVR